MIIGLIPLAVVAIDDSTLSLERSTNGEMIACSPKAVSSRESTVEETNGRDDVDWVGVVLQRLENNFLLRELFPSAYVHAAMLFVYILLLNHRSHAAGSRRKLFRSTVP